MIIKGIFRRYEKWNPVHPTHGAFWGVGVGIGCGVGWGPGFGPEVIGYVGAGCGVGFSVGITLLGLGIGLPANYLLQVPHNVSTVGLVCVELNGNRWIILNIFVLAFMVTSRGALDFARAGCRRGNRSDVQKSLRESFSSFSIENWSEGLTDLPEMKSVLVSRAKRITDHLQRVSQRFFPRDIG